MNANERPATSTLNANTHIRLTPAAIEARALERPNDIAVSDVTRTLTYGDLNARANRVARYLRSLGVRADVAIGLCLPRSVDMVVGALAILKAGAAYLPMDPAYPADRLAFMLDDAQAPVLIADLPVVRRLPVSKRTVVSIGSARISEEPDYSPPLELAPDDLAYIIYTSGSTGRPKGVEITHRSLENLVSWHQQAFSITSADRASHLAGLGFDAAVWELWPYLATGASLHLADDATRSSAELLRDWLLAQGITISFVPTPLAERLLTLNWPRTAALRILLTGGDTLHRYPPKDLPFLLVNNYGPTECTVVATSGTVDPDRNPDVVPAIGCAIANTQIYILDEHLRSAAPGMPGEIYVGGVGLARGYRNRPDLTAEKFVHSPVGGSAGGTRLYRTGDLGRLLPDGQIAFLERIDDLIKIRGYRVEPREIVSALNSHPAVREALVVAREDTPGDKRLVAYLVMNPDDGAAVTCAELRDFLREGLPEYMLPAAFVRLNAFPLLPSGKIDRAALPAPDAENTLRDQDAPAAAPATVTERRVAETIARLLKMADVGRNDNYFLLGGHSLLGAQLIVELRQAFGVEITLRSLFNAPTVAALSAEIERLAGSDNGEAPAASPKLPPKRPAVRMAVQQLVTGQV